MPDDYSSNIDTTGAVTVGGSATGNIETEGDRDWFAVTLEAGKRRAVTQDLPPTPPIADQGTKAMGEQMQT